MIRHTLTQRLLKRTVKGYKPEFDLRQVREDVPAWPVFTEREATVLVHMAEGKTNDEIGRALHISPRTVQTHLSHIAGKLQLDNRTEIAAWVWKRILVDHLENGR